MDSKRFFFFLLEAASNSTRIMGEAGDLIVFMRGEMLGSKKIPIFSNDFL